jgi:hypothetical protein
VTQVTGIELVVDGIQFVQETPTFEQEMFIMQQVVEAGLDTPNVTLGLDPDNPKDLNQPIKQLIVHAYKSKTLFKLLGAMVVEKGTEWSEEQAHRNAELFRTTRDEEGKRQLHPALVGAIIAFFESAGSLEKTFPTSSPEAEESSRQSVSVRHKTTPEQAEALFRSETSALPSEKSPSIKGSRPKKSSRGKSAKG